MYCFMEVYFHRTVMYVRELFLTNYNLLYKVAYLLLFIFYPMCMQIKEFRKMFFFV